MIFTRSERLEEDKRISEMASLLIKHSKDINVKLPIGFTPLDVALFNGNIKLVDLLLASGATANSFKGPSSMTLIFSN